MKFRQWRRWSLRLVSVLLLAVIGAVSGLTGGFWVDSLGSPRADARSRGGDAVWLGHAWVDGEKTQADVDALARQLQGGGVRDLFVHTGPLRFDGSLDPTLYPDAGWVIGALHKAIPGVRVQAWLGQVLDDEGPGLNLAASTDRVEASVGQVLAAGFDGVHVDLEPVHTGDPHFLDILARAHALTTERGGVLSVSVPQTEPVPGAHLVGALAGHPKWWSADYLAQVADRVDQVAVMAYDSGMPTPSLFTGYIEQQTRLAQQSVPASVDLLIGLPAYTESTMGHHGSAETMAAAIRGVRLGDEGRTKFGVAVYVDFTATAADWAAYHRDWAS
ncbi:glycoside hydrolase family 18 protein [Streptacidiphilus sp. PAMC 29251]